LLPVIEPDLNDIYIIGQVGDRLDNLAFKYYGDSSLWWIIARANDIGKGDFTVPIGLQLRIPANQYDIIDAYKILNNIE
jgi:phage tail protein X